MSVEIAAIGVQRPFVLEALEQDFTVHKVWEEADRIAAVRPVERRFRRCRLPIEPPPTTSA